MQKEYLKFPVVSNVPDTEIDEKSITFIFLVIVTVRSF